MRLGWWINKKKNDPDKDWKYQETWEDYPMVNYKIPHTYCRVIFEDGGKSFYYRTRNPDLMEGDLVYVPVGYKYEKKIAKIISIKTYPGFMVPYPLEKTKHIIGKVESNDSKELL